TGPARGTAYLPRQGVPVATLRAMSSPSQVLEHFGAPPITPTDDSPQSCSISQRCVRSSPRISPTRTTGSSWLHSETIVRPSLSSSPRGVGDETTPDRTFRPVGPPPAPCRRPAVRPPWSSVEILELGQEANPALGNH